MSVVGVKALDQPRNFHDEVESALAALTVSASEYGILGMDWRVFNLSGANVIQVSIDGGAAMEIPINDDRGHNGIIWETLDITNVNVVTFQVWIAGLTRL